MFIVKMVSTIMLRNRDTLGDLSTRDVYGRTLYQMSGSACQWDSYLDPSGSNTYTRAASVQSNLDAGNSAGSWSIFVKASGANTLLDTNTATPLVKVTTESTIISSDSTTIAGTLMVDNYVNLGSDLDVTSGSVSVGKNLTVSDLLTVGGNANIIGSLSVGGSILSGNVVVSLAGANPSYDATGLYIANTSANALASLLYSSTMAPGGGASWVSSLPILYPGANTTSVLGSTVKVMNNTDTTKYTALDSNSIGFSGKWKLTYNEVDDQMQLLKYESGSWIVKVRFNT